MSRFTLDERERVEALDQCSSEQRRRAFRVALANRLPTLLLVYYRCDTVLSTLPPELFYLLCEFAIHDNFRFHCSSRVESGPIVPVTTLGGEQLYPRHCLPVDYQSSRPCVSVCVCGTAFTYGETSKMEHVSGMEGCKLTASAYLGAGASMQVEETADVDEDTDPHDPRLVFCPTCNREQEVTPTWLTEVCGRCLSLCPKLDGHGGPAYTCAFHPGLHEVLVDKHERHAHQHVVLEPDGYEYPMDAGEMLFHRPAPGRWTCCGRPCLHDHPQCPLYHPHPEWSVPPLELPDPEHVGCQEAHHALWRSAADLKGDKTMIGELMSPYQRDRKSPYLKSIPKSRAIKWRKAHHFDVTNAPPPDGFEQVERPGTHFLSISEHLALL